MIKLTFLIRDTHLWKYVGVVLVRTYMKQFRQKTYNIFSVKRIVYRLSSLTICTLALRTFTFFVVSGKSLNKVSSRSRVFLEENCSARKCKTSGLLFSSFSSQLSSNPAQNVMHTNDKIINKLQLILKQNFFKKSHSLLSKQIFRQTAIPFEHIVLILNRLLNCPKH